jgi:pyruvate dehydrogenase E1 component alpha subunit
MPRQDAARFTVPYLQILDANGKVDAKLEPGLAASELLRLYRGMVWAREADQRMLRLQRQGRMGTFSPSTGQEAAACGPALAITERDWLVPAFRELGALLMRGVPLHRVLLFWGGFEEGNTFPGVERTLPIAVIVGSQIPHATGLAYAVKYRKETDAGVVCFFGDGATSQGDFHEGLNFAAVWKAPVVFICQNNQWAISTPLAKQTISETIAQKAIAYGIPGVRVDGNDPLAMYVATREALDRAYRGEGPTLIEAVTYRLMMHTTADDPTKYRDDEEVAAWQGRDPLVRFRTYLEAKKVWDEEKETKLRDEVKELVDGEVRTYETLRDLPTGSAFEHLFATSHPYLDEQRDEFEQGLPRKPAHA